MSCESVSQRRVGGVGSGDGMRRDDDDVNREPKHIVVEHDEHRCS